MGGLLLAVALLFFAVSAVAAIVHLVGHREELKKCDAIVVLGAKVLPGGVASGALRARVERAVELYSAGFAPRLVLTGGVGEFPPSEAAVARDLAVALGVPESACLLEEESRSTAENAQNVARLFPDLKTLLVVTDPYHLLRARLVFRKAGLQIAYCPALTAERNMTLKDRLFWTYREALLVLLRPKNLFD